MSVSLLLLQLFMNALKVWPLYLLLLLHDCCQLAPSLLPKSFVCVAQKVQGNGQLLAAPLPYKKIEKKSKTKQSSVTPA